MQPVATGVAERRACSRRPASASSTSAETRVSSQGIELAALRQRGRRRSSPCYRALQVSEPGLVLADVAQQPAQLEDRFGVILDLQRAERCDPSSMSSPAPFEPGRQVLDPRHEERDARRLPHLEQAGARLVTPAGQPQSDDPDAVVGAGNQARQARGPAADRFRPPSTASDRSSSAHWDRAGAPPRGQPAIPRSVRNTGTRGRGRQTAPDRCRDAWPRRRGVRSRPRLADVSLEVRVELVGDRQPRVERERAAEGLFGAHLAVGRFLDVLADHAVAAPEMSPRGRESRVQVEAALIQVACARQPVVRARELVRPQVSSYARGSCGASGVGDVVLAR